MPLWEYVASFTPAELVEQIDFRHITDALSRDEALAMLQRAEPGRSERAQHLLQGGYPAYTTSAGWLGYDDAKVERLARQAVADGFKLIKLKVGADIADERGESASFEAQSDPTRLAIDAQPALGTSPTRSTGSSGLGAVRAALGRGTDVSHDVLGMATIASASPPLLSRRASTWPTE